MNPKDFDFRVWIEDEKRHIYAKDSRLQVLEDCFLAERKEPLGYFATREIEMYSGYLDSTGVRIFENDVVEVNNDEIDITIKGIVKFCKETKSYEVESQDLGELFDFGCEVEVVGYKE